MGEELQASAQPAADGRQVDGCPARDERFPGAHRILKRRDFLRAYEHGRRAHGRLAVIFCYRRDDDGPWRIGLTVTKKTAGAVGRNRQRRRLREFFRRRPGLVPGGWDLVINVKQAALDATHEQFERDLSQILTRLGFGGNSFGPGGGAAA